MGFRSFLHSFAFLLAASATVSALPRPDDSDPVCIVGAGPAGLAAAKTLEDKGRSVVVFEKRPEVGGKCQSYYEKGTFHPLGAVIFTKGTYTETVKIIDSVGAPYDNFTTGEAWNFDWKTGALEAAPTIPAEVAAALATDFGKYAAFWASTFAPLSPIGYKNGVPKELAVPAAEWLASNGYTALGLVINDAMVTFGYGDYREVPMLYVAQFFTPDVLASSLRIVQRYIVDFHDVFVRYSKTIKGPIYTGADIKLITRGKSPIILYNKPGSWIPCVQKCSALVLAFPPTVGALKAAGLTLSKDEKDVFGAVGVINYFSSLVRLSGAPAGLSFWVQKPSPFVPATPEGQPVYFQALHPASSNIANVWSWDKYGIPPDEKKVLRLVTETLSKVNRDPHVANSTNVPVTKKDVVGFSGVVDYFPHVDPPALVDGWYGKFNKLQGAQKTYFASGLNGFETVEFAIRAGRDMVSYL